LTQRSRPPRRAAVRQRLPLLTIACVALVAAGCSRSTHSTSSAPAPAAPVATRPPAPAEAPDGSVRLGDAAAYAAIARGEVTVRSKPGGGRLLGSLPAKLVWGTPTPFLVREARRVHGELWYRVLLPRRPNESSGWLPANQVTAAPRPNSAEVDLSSRRLTLYRGVDAIGSFPVAIGTEGAPTPTGRFFVTVKLRPPEISRVYGDWALGLSAYSEVFDQFGTGDGQIALHGTANGSELGHAVSHGCVRLANPAISTLARLLPPGSPVEIHA
jgi:lipoprotein-anchoring transpeptidase ErfK/SrfK